MLGPAIAPINAVLVKEFHTTYAVVATFSGWQFWPAGVAGLFGSAVGRVWGKRPVYLVSIILLLGGAIWNATATSANSFLGSRILQGFGLGAFETIVPSTIGDMYFVSAHRFSAPPGGVLTDPGPRAWETDSVLQFDVFGHRVFHACSWRLYIYDSRLAVPVPDNQRVLGAVCDFGVLSCAGECV